MLLLKFPTPYGTSTVCGDQLGARSCYASAMKSTNRQHRGEALVVTQAPAPPRAGTERLEDLREESVTQQAEPVEDLELLCSDLVAFLRLNSEKRCAYDLKRYEAMRAKVDKLSTIGFIKEVDYPTWLANVVMVMPFELKNAGATYQRLVNSLFAPLIGNTMEVYVDDMLVKSRTTDQHILNLSALFTILKKYRMRLNPTKCAFEVASGKFLGFMISQRGTSFGPDLHRMAGVLASTSGSHFTPSRKTFTKGTSCRYMARFTSFFCRHSLEKPTFSNPST
ncbi:unnamed protein product [Prunus brigantina]